MSTHWLTTAFDGLVAFLPKLLAGLVILLVGYVVGVLLSRAVRALAPRVGFDRLMTRMGLVKADEPRVGSRYLGSAVYALVMLATIMEVANVWELTFVAAGFARLIGYVPHILGAAVIFGAALLAGNWARERLEKSRRLNPETASGQLRLVPSIVRVGTIAVGGFMALRELQIAPEMVTILFGVTIGAVALAGALAFGLGSREVAGRMTEQWYERRRKEAGANGSATYEAPVKRDVTAAHS